MCDVVASLTQECVVRTRTRRVFVFNTISSGSVASKLPKQIMYEIIVRHFADVILVPRDRRLVFNMTNYARKRLGLLTKKFHYA